MPPFFRSQSPSCITVSTTARLPRASAGIMNARTQIYTRKELSDAIAEWKAALTACSTGKSYTIDGRSLTRYDLAEIRKHLAWLLELEAAMSGYNPMRRIRPMIRR